MNSNNNKIKTQTQTQCKSCNGIGMKKSVTNICENCDGIKCKYLLETPNKYCNFISCDECNKYINNENYNKTCAKCLGFGFIKTNINNKNWCNYCVNTHKICLCIKIQNPWTECEKCLGLGIQK